MFLRTVAHLSVLSATIGLCASQMDDDQPRVQLPPAWVWPPVVPAVPLDDLLWAIRIVVQAGQRCHGVSGSPSNHDFRFPGSYIFDR